MYVEARGHACSVGSARAVRTRVTTDLFRCFSSDCAKLLILAGQGACACVCVNERARESERERGCALVLQHERRGRQTVMMLVSYSAQVRAR